MTFSVIEENLPHYVKYVIILINVETVSIKEMYEETLVVLRL